jgi:hypothetical protein
MADNLYSGLTVDVHKTEDGQLYVFTVNMDGADVVIGSRKTGGVDADIQRAKSQAEQPE